MKNILEFKDVSFIRGDKKILDHVNWTVKPKENWAILGLNGAGKSTLLKMINGEIWPSEGELSVLGNRFGSTNIPMLKRQIGWVSNALQDFIRPADKVESIVLSGKFASIGIYEEYTADDMQTAKQTIMRLGGESLLGKSYRVLSQGERQLVLIARALMAKPKLLILDEPCNGLDLFARERLLKHVAEIANDPDSPALLMVSHYTEELLPCFDHVMFLKHGHVYEQGERESLLHAEQLSAFYGEPITVLHDNQQRVIVYPK